MALYSIYRTISAGDIFDAPRAGIITHAIAATHTTANISPSCSTGIVNATPPEIYLKLLSLNHKRVFTPQYHLSRRRDNLKSMELNRPAKTKSHLIQV